MAERLGHEPGISEISVGKLAGEICFAGSAGIDVCDPPLQLVAQDAKDLGQTDSLCCTTGCAVEWCTFLCGAERQDLGPHSRPRQHTGPGQEHEGGPFSRQDPVEVALAEKPVPPGQSVES